MFLLWHTSITVKWYARTISVVCLPINHIAIASWGMAGLLFPHHVFSWCHFVWYTSSISVSSYHPTDDLSGSVVTKSGVCESFSVVISVQTLRSTFRVFCIWNVFLFVWTVSIELLMFFFYQLTHHSIVWRVHVTWWLTVCVDLSIPLKLFPTLCSTVVLSPLLLLPEFSMFLVQCASLPDVVLFPIKSPVLVVLSVTYWFLYHVWNLSGNLLL